MTIKVTLEFSTVDETIVALGKLVGGQPSKAVDSAVMIKPAAGPSATNKRRGRSDKGQQRGPYKTDAPLTATQVLADEKAYIAEHAAKLSDTTSAIIQPIVDKTLAILKTAAPDATSPSGLTQPAEAPAAAVPVYKQADIQAAVQKIFAEKGLDTALKLMQQFGATSYSKIKPESYAEFMTKVGETLAGS